MNQEVWVAIYGVVYVLTLLIGKGINLRNIVNSGNELTAEFNKEIAIPNNRIIELEKELAVIKAINTILVKELITNYQDRLEITNDHEEEIKLLAKIKFLSELLT